MQTQEHKVHWKKVFNSDYLGSCDLEDKNDLKAIIKNVVIKKVKNTDGKETERNIAIFTDPKLKPMVLNATNCKIMKKFAKSPYIDDWNNIPVQIYVKDDVKAFGDITEGLRLRDFQPSFNKPKLTRNNEAAWTGAIEFLKNKGTLEEIRKKYELTVQDGEQLQREAV
jgi:hypothetical protein